MKAKLFLTLLLSFPFYLLSSQVPQGFNYQAIATDAGLPITTAIDVKITIQSLETGGTQFWIEQHSGVVPNSQGLFTIIIGSGVPQSGRTVTAFSDIDWSVTPKYIKTEVLYGTWKNMGAAKLQSVPYSLVAKNLGGPVDKLGVTGKTTNMEEALFEVKNQTGKTVFAVYNEGVRIYVEDGAKGSKGGFAIGGFDVAKGTPGQEYFKVDPGTIKMFIKNDIASKSEKGGFSIGGYGGAKGGPIQKYLRISNDSTRFYVNDDPAQKGEKGGFSIGGFSESKTVKNFFNVQSPLAAPSIINPSENRILFHPQKNAFLVGRVLITDINNVGENSFVSGYESMAKGMYSQSLGFKTKALGDYSTAIGKNAEANSNNSFALGDGAKATQIDSYAIGAGALASGQGSFAFGSVGRDTATFVPNTQPTEASGNYSFAIGLGAKSTGTSSTAIGIQSSAAGNAAMALGVSSRADGEKSLALNVGWAYGKYSMAFGSLSKAQGDYSIAIGRGASKFGIYNIAAGGYSIALGYSRVYGTSSIGIGTADVGTSTTACDYGIAIGNSAKTTGQYATAIGTLVTASSLRSFVVGTNNVVDGSATAWVADDPLFVVGNGMSPTSTSNAFTVLKNAKTGIGTANPGYNLESYGANASLIAHYLSNARGGIAALSGGRVAVLTTAATDDIVFGYSSTVDQESFSSNFVERMRLDNGTGNVSIGTASTSYKLEVGGTLRVTGALNFSDPFTRTCTSPRVMYVNAAGEVGGISSSIKYKENVNNLDNYGWLYELRPVSYNYKNTNQSEIQYGLIAEEVDGINSQLVIYGADKKPDGLMYDRLTVPMLKAIQDQEKQIETLKEEIAQLKSILERSGIK